MQNIDQEVFDTAVGHKHSLPNVKVIILTKNWAWNLWRSASLYLFLGCDIRSAFVRIVKATFIKNSEQISRRGWRVLDFGTLFRNQRYLYAACKAPQDALVWLNCGIISSQENFKAKYGLPVSNYNGIDLSLLSPCRASLKMHDMYSKLPGIHLEECSCGMSSKLNAQSTWLWLQSQWGWSMDFVWVEVIFAAWVNWHHAFFWGAGTRFRWWNWVLMLCGCYV